MMEPYTPSLENDYKICESIIKEHSKSFYYAFSSLPELDAKAVYAIYAFCRMADDAIDHAEDTRERLENLRKLESDLNDFIDGIPPDTPMWRALKDTCERYDIDESMLYAQIRGQEMDVNFEQPKDMKDLIHYSNHVAGSVGRLLLPILCDDPGAERKVNAEKLGVAMQFTNILRDVGEDMRQHGRVYIPSSVLKEHGCAMNQIEQGKVDQVFINVWEDLAVQAEAYYDGFRSEIIHYKKEARLPLLMSLSVYREILDEVRKNRYDCFTKRNIVSMARKVKIRNEEIRFLRKIKDA